MKTKSLAAVAILATALSGASLFAEPRHDERTDSSNWRDSRADEIRLEGRIRDIDRDRNGFVIRLDGNRTKYFAPANLDLRYASRRRADLRRLERGDVIRVRGFQGAGNGMVVLSEIDLVRDADARAVSGIVEAIDRDRGMLWLRGNGSRKFFAVHMDRDALRDRTLGLDFSEVRRGQYVTVLGEWHGSGRFVAYDINRDVRW